MKGILYTEFCDLQSQPTGGSELELTICGHVYAHQGHIRIFQRKKKKRKKGKGQSGVSKVRRGSLAT